MTIEDMISTLKANGVESVTFTLSASPKATTGKASKGKGKAATVQAAAAATVQAAPAAMPDFSDLAI